MKSVFEDCLATFAGLIFLIFILVLRFAPFVIVAYILVHFAKKWW